ncbi:unnamed protein product [Hydatigera taeniaeformis]|uniref:WH2 domain-containing protein n=1 Tax=Hydatigena taeniaeformis TaxID=6205 RepID=A0A0R3WVC0_HYDTA|nr:unnamed protein product [Hydatigera taeniaeformis]
MSTPLLRRNSLCLASTTSTRVSSQSSASSPLAAQPLSRTPMSSASYVPGRGSLVERKPPHVILPITPTPPPLPPPPPNPQLAPLKPRSRSQQWTSSKAFGIGGLEKLPAVINPLEAGLGLTDGGFKISVGHLKLSLFNVSFSATSYRLTKSSPKVVWVGTLI